MIIKVKFTASPFRINLLNLGHEEVQTSGCKRSCKGVLHNHREHGQYLPVTAHGLRPLKLCSTLRYARDVRNTAHELHVHKNKNTNLLWGGRLWILIYLRGDVEKHTQGSLLLAGRKGV